MGVPKLPASSSDLSTKQTCVTSRISLWQYSILKTYATIFTSSPAKLTNRERIRIEERAKPVQLLPERGAIIYVGVSRHAHGHAVFLRNPQWRA